MDIMYRLGLGEGEHMLCFVCVSMLGGKPLVNKCLFIVYEQFNEVHYITRHGTTLIYMKGKKMSE